MEQYVLKGKLILSGKIQCLTGLHIGGYAEEMEIGGNDNPVLRNPISEEPYIPGSALKGKLRSLSEWSLGLIEKHQRHNTYGAYACKELEKDENKHTEKYQNAYCVACLYGPATDSTKVKEVAGPSRLTVRDAFLTPEAKDLLNQSLGSGIYTEVKTENALDRVTSEANPRPIERVPAGASFEFNLVLDIYQQSDFALLRELLKAMHLLENSALGGGGARGNGQVAFEDLKITWRSVKYYTGEEPQKDLSLPGKSLAEVIQGFDSIAIPSAA